MAAREIGHLAMVQLKAWEEIALDRQTYLANRLGTHLTCGECHMTITPLTDPGGIPYYRMTLGIMLAATVAHLRNYHRDLDPDRGSDGTS